MQNSFDFSMRLQIAQRGDNLTRLN